MRVNAQQPGNESPHGELKWDCQVCHTSVSWKKLKDPSDFKHEKTGFPLLGVHKIVDCRSCHQSLKFTEVRTNCSSCHTDIHQSQFGIDCQSCHTPDNWQNQQEIFNLHSERGFPLIGVHAIADCEACHVNQQINEFAGTPIDCNGCHANDFMVSENPDHVKAGFSLECQNCHQPMTTGWSQTRFQHGSMELQGAHVTLDCNSCHVNTYAGTTSECYSCHSTDYLQTVAPAHNTYGFPTDCNICHNQNQWQGAQFDHVQFTGFELRGAHAFILCSDCHVNNQYVGLPQDCFGCHENDYNNVPDPSHVTNAFPTDCITCHNETSWEQVTFDHNLTQFPLTGAHVTLECIDCHSSGYTSTASDCYSCHEQDYNSVNDPNHASNNFNLDCTQCHSTSAWSPSTFDHNQTQFPLTGAHLTLQCVDCHSAGYTGTPTDCYTCHQQDYNSVTDPNHVTNNFNLDCTQCHNTAAWSPAFFDHNQTQFPLTGAHLTLECIACHAQGYSGTPTDCYTCHQQDYNSVTDPNHVTNNFNLDCTQCHSTSAWSPSTFDHNQTQFPLTGAHLTLQCVDCHSGGYTGTPTDCYSCHQQDFNTVTDPNHVANNFSHDCMQCHTTAAWSPASFDHNQTQFPLTGAHLTLDCIACHAQGYSGTPTDCYSCHQQDFNTVTDPNHVANNFSHDCTQCHTTAAWSPASFDHNQTQFPLTGAHLTLDCIACHAQGYTGTPTDCYSCHQQDFNTVTDPNHVTNNFSHDCTQCHNTSAWSPATFDHNQTQFPLTGAHAMLPCLACHSNGYTGTPTDCYSCHQQEYNNTTNPNHQAAGFPTNCEACHNTIVWTQTTWDHDSQYFPIYSGRHQGEWNVCADCHVNPNNYQVFECIFCHEHDNEQEVGQQHQGVPGYVYLSTACYACHPNGNGKL